MPLEEEKDRACQEIARWLKESDKKTVHSDEYYYSEAQKRITGFRWQLYKLNRPFIWLEKKIIEPLDFWSDRANVFQFFSKVSPIIQAIGVLAIPFVIFYYENQRVERQLRFEENIISAQAEVRQQQAVRDYLSQITTVYLEVKQEDPSKEKEELKKLKKLLEATTLALFDELSISEDSRSEQTENIEFDWEAVKRDQKGEVIHFLSNLGWINSLNNEEEPLLSLRESNLSQANLFKAKLKKADLSEANLGRANLVIAKLVGANLEGTNLKKANLEGANLYRAKLFRTNLEGANLREANLEGANLVLAKLGGANLEGTNLKKANLKRANLKETNLKGAILAYKQIKLACNWADAFYKEDFSENQKYIEELKKNKSSDPTEPPDCSRGRVQLSPLPRQSFQLNAQ